MTTTIAYFVLTVTSLGLAAAFIGGILHALGLWNPSMPEDREDERGMMLLTTLIVWLISLLVVVKP